MGFTTFNCTGLTGGTLRTLDTLSVQILIEGDRAVVMDSSDELLFFKFDADSTLAENTSVHPYRVRPDDYSSQGVWLEQISPHVTNQVNLLTNSGFGVWSNGTLANVGTQVTLTDVTSGVCLTTDTQDLVIGKLWRFNSGDFDTEVYEITALTTDTSFTLHDTSLTDSGSPGTGYEVEPAITSGTNGPDGWFQDTTLDVQRKHNDGGTNTKDGSFYSLMMTPSTQHDYMLWPSNINATEVHLQKFAGRTVTFGAWVKSSTASDVLLRVRDLVSSDSDSSMHTGGGGWEWLEVTHTVNASPSTFDVQFRCTNVAPGVTYISQPMLILGDYIGEGNYVQEPEQMIPCETGYVLNSFDLASFPDTGSATTINLEAESNGRTPKGVKAVWVRLQARDADTGTGNPFFALFGKQTAYHNLMVDLDIEGTDHDNKLAYAIGTVWCDTNGDISYKCAASIDYDLDARIAILGVML